MTVKEFITIDDAKITVEKPVKEKPKIEELTVIESPGRPVPAINFVKKKKEKRKKAHKPKASSLSTSISEAKKEHILIITEKPQAAQKIASSLGNAKRYNENGVSYFEVERNGEKITVASAVGHLFNLTYAEGEKGYPIFNVQWQPSFERATSAFTKKYYTLLKTLSRKAKSFVIAMDYDIEGEVIGWNVIRFICNQESAKRMKFSTLTKNELEKSYENALPELDWRQAYAGESRHILDWLYGINLSRALMSSIKKSGSFKILSIGRVQGPALKIIVDREREINNFKPQPYWNVFAVIDKFPYKHLKDIFDKKELEKFKDIKEGIADTKETEESISPLHPFDLTTLQREAYRLYKINPSQTLSIAQKLYLDGLISYPRTSSQKLPEIIEPKKILKELEKHFPNEVKIATREKPIEGKKSDPAHPSIYPTGEYYKKLEDRDKKIYELIVRRFISAFSPNAKTLNKKVTITTKDNIIFTASGLKIKDKGWTAVYPSTLEESNVPTLSGKVKIDEIKIEEKETQPPKRYTPTSLITILEKKNLGTKATRSMIVDTLFERGYLEGTSIKATPLGIRLIESLEKYAPIIIDENLTRQLEEQMEDIQNSENTTNINLKQKEDKIVETAKRLISDISKEFKVKEFDIGKDLLVGIENQRKEQQELNVLMPCPICKQGNLKLTYSQKTKKQFVACSNYPNCTATYSLPPNSFIKNTGKKNEEGLPLLLAIRKGRKPWQFPFDPHWREKQNATQNNQPQQ